MLVDGQQSERFEDDLGFSETVEFVDKLAYGSVSVLQFCHYSVFIWILMRLKWATEWTLFINYKMTVDQVQKWINGKEYHFSPSSTLGSIERRTAGMVSCTLKSGSEWANWVLLLLGPSYLEGDLLLEGMLEAEPNWTFWDVLKWGSCSRWSC